MKSNLKQPLGELIFNFDNNFKSGVHPQVAGGSGGAGGCGGSGGCGGGGGCSGGSGVVTGDAGAEPEALVVVVLEAPEECERLKNLKYTFK